MVTTGIMGKSNSKCSFSSIVSQDIKAGIQSAIHVLIKNIKEIRIIKYGFGEDCLIETFRCAAEQRCVTVQTNFGSSLLFHSQYVQRCSVITSAYRFV